MTVTISNKKKLSEYTFSDLKDFFYDLSRKISSKVILLEIGNDFFNIALAKSSNGNLLIKKVYRQNLPKEAIEKSLPTAHNYIIQNLKLSLDSIEKNFLQPNLLLEQLVKTEKVLNEGIDAIRENEFSKEILENP